MKKLFLLMVTACLFACGQKTENVQKDDVVKPLETEVTGDFDGCFTVEDREYKVVKEKYSTFITVEMQRTDQAFPFELNGRKLCTFGENEEKANVQVGLSLELLDQDGNVVEKVSPTSYGAVADESEIFTLMKLKAGKKCTVRFKVPTDASGYTAFRVLSTYVENEAEPETSDNDISTDEDLDKALEEMDKVVDVTKSAASAIKDMAGALK